MITVAARVGTLLCLAGSGCSTSKPPADCSTRPGYEIVVTAVAGSLPGDLKLRLDYDSGCEIYDLAQRKPVPCYPGGEAGVLFCSTTSPGADAGLSDASATVGTLTCNVWGVGAGTVTALTAAYPAEPVSLGRDAPGCDPTTIPVVLLHADAGP